MTHLGHHLGEGIAGGRARVIKAINNAVRESSSSVMLLLENTAGEKNSVGSSFEHIGAILDEPRSQVVWVSASTHAMHLQLAMRPPY